MCKYLWPVRVRCSKYPLLLLVWHRIGKYTVCRCVCTFQPENLRAGVVKGLRATRNGTHVVLEELLSVPVALSVSPHPHKWLELKPHRKHVTAHATQQLLYTLLNTDGSWLNHTENMSLYTQAQQLLYTLLSTDWSWNHTENMSPYTQAQQLLYTLLSTDWSWNHTENMSLYTQLNNCYTHYSVLMGAD